MKTKILELPPPKMYILPICAKRLGTHFHLEGAGGAFSNAATLKLCTWFLLKKKHGQITSFKPISNNDAVGRTTFWLVQDVCLSYMHTTEMHPFLGLLSTLVVLVLWEFWRLPFPEPSEPSDPKLCKRFFVSSGHMFFCCRMSQYIDMNSTGKLGNNFNMLGFGEKQL